MDPATISLIAGFAIKYGIPAAQKLIELYQEAGAEISLEQWNKVFEPAQKSYAQYIAEASSPTAATAP